MDNVGVSLNLDRGRNLDLDFMKAWVMIWLPFYHTLAWSNNAILQAIGSIIYSYQMVLLMMISGYLSYKGSEQIDLTWLLKRAKRLVIPWIVWGIVGLVFQRTVFHRAINSWNDFSYLYWFFASLFLNSALLYIGVRTWEMICSKIREVSIIPILLVMDLLLKMVSLKIDYCIVKLSSWHITFFFIGYLLHRYKEKIRKWYAALALLIFGVGNVCIMQVKLNSFASGYVVEIIKDYLYALFLVTLIYCIACVLPLKIKAYSTGIAKCSMYIYIIHEFLLIEFTPYAYRNIIISSVLGVVIPLMIAYIVHKYDLKVKVLFGEI